MRGKKAHATQDQPMEVLLSLASNFTTAPVALGISEAMRGILALTAVLVIITRIIGAVTLVAQKIRRCSVSMLGQIFQLIFRHGGRRMNLATFPVPDFWQSRTAQQLPVIISLTIRKIRAD